MARAGLEREPDGPGAFRVDDDGALVPNPVARGRRPWLDAVVPVDSGGRGGDLLLRLDEADVAVLYGAEAGRLLRGDPPGLRVERLPARDRVYFLWIDRSRRWVNDPRFRRWLAGVVERESMLRHLFDGRGSPALTLSDGDRVQPVWSAEERRPLSRDSAPRLTLGYEEGDRHARVIAGRLREQLSLLDVHVTTRARRDSRTPEAIREGRPDLVILSHCPPTGDPVLALLDTVSRLGEAARDAAVVLEQASRSPGRQARGDGAWLAEEALLRDADVVPLVRLHAWLAARAGLVGLAAGPGGRLRFEEARWSR